MNNEDSDDLNYKSDNSLQPSALSPNSCDWCLLCDTDFCPHAWEVKEEDFNVSKCPEFKPKPLETDEGLVFNFGINRVMRKGAFAIFCIGDQPQYAVKISKLGLLASRKKVAKSLGIEVSFIDPVAAKLLTTTQSQEDKFKQDLDSLSVKTQSSTPQSEENIKEKKEIKEKAMNLLRNPHILCNIDTGFREQGLVGETKNAFTTFFDMLSTLTDNPINKRWSGRSGVGKSAIVTKVSKVFPQEMIIIRSGLTKKAIWHMLGSVEIDDNTRFFDFKGLVLVLLEESESKDFLSEGKPLLSHDMYELKYEFTVKEKQGLTTHVQILRGWPAYIGITTVPELREEQQTRALIGTPDRGEIKYKSIMIADATHSSEPWKTHPIIWTSIIQEAIRQLKPLKVWIPWLSIVAEAFPAKEAKSMREWFFFRSFLESITLLFQYQLAHVIFNNVELVAAPPFILELALLIGEAAFRETITGLEKDLSEFYEHLRKQSQERWTRKEFLEEYRRYSGERIGRTTLVERFLNKYVDLGLMDVDESKKPYKYAVTEESLPLLTEFKNILEKVRSDKTKRVLTSKTLSSNNPSQTPPEPFYQEGKTLPWDEFWDYIYSFHPDDNVMKLFTKSKEEEYRVNRLFPQFDDDDKELGEKKPDLPKKISELSLLEKVETYVQDQRDVGLLRAAKELNLARNDFLKIAASSSNIVFGRNRETVRWRERALLKN